MTRHLLIGTALQTGLAFMAVVASAQPAPNARPSAGAVVAGSARISQTTANTRIEQSSQRAAIDWKSFDVGSAQSVTFQQPNAQAVALNRVTGPDPSQIAGRIDANGQIVLVNQSGVNFYKGAQVNAAGVMVSAAGISNQNFMAGRMAFDQPARANARIDNAGSITVKQAGLAALVAPQVVNSGTITAQLGHVVLAGAKTATLDLYGDGLLSLDVTDQVKEAPAGPDGKPVTALVTNTGVVVADGGTVQLTARAADGIVQNLVQAGGKIRAATIGGKTGGDQTGTIALNGVGGSIVVSGQLSAPGRAPGTAGGNIEVVSDGNVILASTARIGASGQTGGGTVAIGTTLARAKGGPGVAATQTAKSVVVQQGATIAADAKSSGSGGRVAALSAGTTQMNGAISAKGGLKGGNGGFVEVSGANLSMSTSSIDVSAPAGASGTILLDPRDLDIAANNTIDVSRPGVPVDRPDQNTDATVSAQALTNLTGDLVIEASRNLTVDAPLFFGRQLAGSSVSLLAGNDLAVNKSISTAGGSLNLSAAVSTDGTHSFTYFDPAGSLTINANLGSGITGAISLSGGTGGVTIGANVESAGNVQISSTGGITQVGPATPPVGLNSDLGELHIIGLNINLTAGGDITQTGYVDIFARAQTTVQAGGSVLQSGPTQPATPPVSTTGALLGSIMFGETGVSVTASQDVTQSGYSRISSNVGGTVAVSAVGDVVQAGSAQIYGDTTNVSAGGSLQQNGASLIAVVARANTGSVSVSAGKDVSETGTSSIFGQSLSLTAGGSLDQTDGASIRFTNATVTADGVSLGGNAQLLASALQLNLGSGGLAMTGDSLLGGAGSSVAMASSGPVSEAPTAVISAATLSSAGVTGNAALLGAGNAITVLSGFRVTDGDLVIVDGSDLTLSGTLQANNLFVEVARTGGALSFGFADDSATPSPAILNAGDGGRISLVADKYNIVSPANIISTAGGMVELAPFSAINTSLLGTNGLVIGSALLSGIDTGGGTLRVGGYTHVLGGAKNPAPSASGVTIDGAAVLTSVASTLDLEATGSIVQSAPLINAGTLTATISGSGNLLLSNPNNGLSTLGPVSVASGAIDLVDALPLQVAGPLSANRIGISATGILALEGNVATGATANGGGATFTVLPDVAGDAIFVAVNLPLVPAAAVASLSSLNFLPITVSPLNGPTATVAIDLPPSGGISETLLNGPSTDLVLNLGSGNAGGEINVGSFVVNGAGGFATFTNSTVGGLTGGAAATAAQSNPPNNAQYTLNGCEIGVGCVAPITPITPVTPVVPITPITPPIQNGNLAQGITVSTGIANIVSLLADDATTAAVQSAAQSSTRGLPIVYPMRDLANGPLRDRQDDPDLLLPNVSEKDY
jgi:filamentous hemagglutinin family protein